MTKLQLPLDEDVVKKASDMLLSHGITIEEALGRFLNDIAAGNGAIEYLKIPNEKTRAAIEQASVGDVKRFGSVDALMADLNADD